MELCGFYAKLNLNTARSADLLETYISSKLHLGCKYISDNKCLRIRVSCVAVTALTALVMMVTAPVLLKAFVVCVWADRILAWDHKWMRDSVIPFHIVHNSEMQGAFRAV